VSSCGKLRADTSRGFSFGEGVLRRLRGDARQVILDQFVRNTIPICAFLRVSLIGVWLEEDFAMDDKDLAGAASIN
jgi:hypothetical protein